MYTTNPDYAWLYQFEVKITFFHFKQNHHILPRYDRVHIDMYIRRCSGIVPYGQGVVAMT